MAKGKKEIDRKIERARKLIRKGRYIPGPDHFVLSDVSWENYRYFMERLREVVMTTKPGTDKPGQRRRLTFPDLMCLPRSRSHIGCPWLIIDKGHEYRAPTI